MFCQIFANLFLQNFAKNISANLATFLKMFAIFRQNSSKNVILELCKGVHCVDLDESFQTHIYLQNLASMQPRTSPLNFAASRDSRRSARCATRLTGPADAPAESRPRLRGRGRSSTATGSSRDASGAPRSLCQFLANFQQNFARFRLYRRRSLQ